MVSPRETSLHIEAGGKYPGLRVYLEALLSGSKLDSVEEELNSYTQFLSLRTYGSGDPMVYGELEKQTEDTFNKVAGCVPVGDEGEFYNLLIKLASRTHAYAYNPFLIARSYVAIASSAFDELTPEKSLFEKELRDYHREWESLKEISLHLKAIKVDSMAEGVKLFGSMDSRDFRDTSIYGVAHPCVKAVDSLIRVPDSGSGDSWTDLALPFWKNLRFFAPMSRTKMLAAGQLSRLLQLQK